MFTGYESLNRVECTAPGAPNTQQTCWSMGCCWDNSSAIALADFKIPRCFHLTPSEYSYTVSQVDTNPNNDISMKIYPEFSYRVAGVSPTTANVQVQCKDNTHVAISMSKEIIQPSDVSLVSCENILSSSNEGSRFMINITDSYGKPIVAIGGSPMFFAPNYVEFTVFLLSGSSVFGLGQSTRSNHTLDKHWDEIVIFGNAPTIQVLLFAVSPFARIDAHFNFAGYTSNYVVITGYSGFFYSQPPYRQLSLTY